MSTGQTFGEQALLTGKRRAATIICSTECHFATLNKQDYQKFIGAAQMETLMKEIEFLKSCPYFSHWTNKPL